MLKGKPLRNTYFDDFKGPCNYPQRTVAGMYKQEQELAKADEVGLIITADDLEPKNTCESCGLGEAYPDGLCAKCWNAFNAIHE